MVDIQEENAILSKPAPQDGGAEVAAAVSEVCKDSQKPSMSEGEKKFETIAYTGLNYWVNLISSIFMADYMLRSGTKGREFLDALIKKSAIGLSKTQIIPLKSAFEYSKTAIETGTLLLGGTIVVMPPLKWLEDNKRKVVHWLNDKLGVDQTAPDGHKETADEIHIEKEQPPQSWGRVLLRRLYCILTVMGSGIVINKLFKDKNNFNDPITYKVGNYEIPFDRTPVGGKQHITEKVFGWIDKAKEHLTGSKFAKNGWTSRLTQLLILDSVFTYVTKIVMYITAGAEKAKMPSEIDCSDDAKAHLVKNHIIQDVPQASVEASNDSHFSDKVARREIKPVEKKEKTRPEDYINLGSSSAVTLGVGA